MEYDYDIRETFNNYLGKDMLFNLDNIINDYEMLRLATEFLRIARDRLNSDLKDNKIYEEYTKINVIIKELEEIIKNYV